MACGHIAFNQLGMDLSRYVAYEIDKYAIKTATHNFSDIEEQWDVFTADFSQYENCNWLIGGSPCTYWSITRSTNRETTASGMGWELFSQYVRALDTAKPEFFLYENNQSMSKEIRQSIDSAFGFDAVEINSSLVSAQSRRRLYWVGWRTRNGTYRKVDVAQPEDRGIFVKDILESGYPLREKAYTLKATHAKAGIANLLSGQHFPANGAAEPVRIGTIESVAKNADFDSQQYRIYSPDGKSVTLCGQGGGVGAKTGLYAVPLTLEWRGSVYPVYQVKDGFVSIKGKQHPIQLADGFYAIRKLIVPECKRLQTVPDWYEFPVSDTQAYRMLGNGWTCLIIQHLIASAMRSN